MTLRSKSFGFASLLLALITCASLGWGVSACGRTQAERAGGNSAAPAASRFVYVFSPEGNYAKLDVDTLVVVANGSLSEAEIDGIEGIVPDPEHKDLLIETLRAWSPDAPGPTRGLVILRAVREGAIARLRVTREVAPPRGMDQFVGVMVVPGAVRRILASWAGPDGVATLALTGDSSDPARSSDAFVVRPASCVGSDGARVYSLAPTKPIEVRSLTLKDLSVQSVPARLETGFAPMITAGTGGGCRILIVGRPGKPTTEPVQMPAYIYDLEKQSIVRGLTLQGHGDFSLSPDASLVAGEEKTFVPNVLASGQTVGLKYKKTGVLRVYDAAAGTQIAVAKLPEDGQLSAIERSLGYYVSPGLLTVIDLRSGKITATVKLPFARGFVAFHDES